MKKKRRIWIALCVALAIGIGVICMLVFQRKTDECEIANESSEPIMPGDSIELVEPMEPMEEWLKSFPVLPVPSVYQGNLGSGFYAVFVESSDVSELKGHYLSLSDEVSDTIAFTLSAEGSRVRFISRDVDVSHRVKKIREDDSRIDGRIRNGLMSYTPFSFARCEMPAFESFDTTRYLLPQFEVRHLDSIHFADVEGYWTELDELTNSAGDMIFQLGKARDERDLDLYMDVYYPKGDTLAKRPLVMLIHGGAFYYGTRKDITTKAFCEHLASLGYVTASIDYRIGFQPTKDGIERAGYCAIQDAHSAMRYLVANRDKFGIDTSMLIVGGCSAGGITALGLTFMTNETRPESTCVGNRKGDLGGIETSGNDIDVSFSIKCVADMWGAMPSLEMLEGRNVPIVAFHGNMDNIVPYDFDYPFAMAGFFKKTLFDKMYGSSCIVERAKELGVKAELYTFDGYKHSPQLTKKALNENYYFIQDTMSRFFSEVVRPVKPQIKKGNQKYYLDKSAKHVSWQVEGGFVCECDEKGIKVVWIGNAPQRRLKVAGIQQYGTGFVQGLKVE